MSKWVLTSFVARAPYSAFKSQSAGQQIIKLILYALRATCKTHASLQIDNTKSSIVHLPIATRVFSEFLVAVDQCIDTSYWT